MQKTGEKDRRERKSGKPLTPETLARILRGVTVEEDAAETYERLTGKKIPERGEQDDEVGS